MDGATGKVRLIAVDLDGTLLSKGNQVSEGDAAAVRDAVAAGVHIVLATSRWYRLAKRTADMLGVTSPIICHNGAMVRVPADGSRLLQLDIPPATALEIAAMAEDRGYGAVVTVDDVTHVYGGRRAVDAARVPHGMVPAAELSHLVARGAESFLFFGQDAVDGMRALLGDRYDGVLNVAHGFSETYPPYLNIVHAGADKGRALRIVCEHVGIPTSETMAIGDAAPDLEMMRVAGLSMAMGNAPDDVKAQADVVGPGNREDGVAWAIRRYAL